MAAGSNVISTTFINGPGKMGGGADRERRGTNSRTLAGQQAITHWDQVTYEWLLAVLADANTEWQRVVRDYYDGLHFSPGDEYGAGWIGPWPNEKNVGYSDARSEIERGFVSANKVAEVTDRSMHGVVGKEPAWDVTLVRPLGQVENPETGDMEEEGPTIAEGALIDEANALLTEWWDSRKSHQTLQDGLITALLEDRGPLRIFIPRRFVGPYSVIPPGPPEQQATRVFVQDVAPQDGMVYRDETEMLELGLFAYWEGGVQRVEVTFVDDATGETVIRWYGDRDKDPLLLARAGIPEGGTLILDGAGAPISPDLLGEIRMPLDGRMIMHEMNGLGMISEQVVQNQKLINLAMSMLPRNANLAGFLERIILNGEVPGHWENDPAAAGGRVWVNDTYRTGAATTNFISGIESEDAEGKISITSPSVVYKDPVSPIHLTETKLQAYQAILEETDQLHALIAGDAEASGESRRQAMAAFLADLRVLATHCNDAGRWMLETVLSMSAVLAKQPGRYSGLRVDFSCRLDPGPSTADEMRIALEAADKGVLSIETAMGYLGVDDPAAEKLRIDGEKQEAMERFSSNIEARAEGGGENGFGALFGGREGAPPADEGDEEAE